MHFHQSSTKVQGKCLRASSRDVRVDDGMNSVKPILPVNEWG